MSDHKDVALRLLDTSPAPAPTPAATPTEAETGPQLVAQARSAIASGDLDTLRRLAAQTAQIDDVHRRYGARQALVEEALHTGSERSGAAAATAMLAAATLGLELLAVTPSEPVLLNLTAVALYELGAYRGAEALFRAARDLDPTLPHVDTNLRALKRARKAGVKIALAPQIARDVPVAGKRAEQLAARAGRTAPESIALCMIVKDEEKVLDRCLASVDGIVDELIVVDTGSTDRTVEIAERHGAKVLHHVWNDDFAAARNVGVEAATADWILFLDADEWFEPGAAAKLKDLTRKPWREGYRLPIHNRVGSERAAQVVVHEALRLFRNRPQHRFSGRVHENVFHAVPGDRLEAGGDVRIEHDGYLNQAKAEKDKQQRNLELLEQQVREEPTHFVHYNLGSEYVGLGRIGDALKQLERAWTLLQADPIPAEQPFAPSLAARYADALNQAGRPAEAIAIAQSGLEMFPGFTDLVYVQAAAAKAQGDLDRARALLTQCLELGDASTVYVRQVGCGTFLAAIDLAGVLAAQGHLETAEQLLRQTLADHPDVLATIDPLATVMLANGSGPDDVLATVTDVVGEPSTDVRFALASAFQATGHPVAAETQLRALLAADATNDAARVGLADALLARSAFTEAAQVAAAVDVSSPWSPAAVTAQAFAAIVAECRPRGADSVGTSPQGGESQPGRPLVADALDRAQAAGVDGAETALLTAWAANAGLVEAPLPAIGASAFGLLVTSLEALLRVEQFDAFGALAPLAELVMGVPARDRHEHLAQMYLRRGFLDSAADEWAAACQIAGPDANAMAGLAQVAARTGAHADAREFAEAALELDPAQPEAAQLLELLPAAA